MAIWKFNDYQAFTGAIHRGDVKPNATVKIGYVGKLDPVNGDFRQLVDDTDALDEIWLVGNIDDKPETLNTDDLQFTTDDYVRIFKLDGMVGKRIEITSDMCSTAFADVAVGDYLIPNGAAWTFVERSTETGTYNVALLVKSKTTMGNFTIDNASVGGYICEIVKVTWS